MCALITSYNERHWCIDLERIHSRIRSLLRPTYTHATPLTSLYFASTPFKLYTYTRLPCVVDSDEMATDGGMIEGTKPTTEATRGKDDQEGQPKVPEKTGNPALMLSREDVGLLGITATGNFLDAYDYFIINPVSTMIQYELFAGNTLPPRLEGYLKSGALIGSVLGQLLFGYLGDAFGRKAIYGKELLTVIIGTILCLSTPTGVLSPSNSLIYLASFRIIVGIGIGGDYPMSSSITTDRTAPWKRGTVLAYIVAMQGWGSLVGSLVAIIVLAAYKHVINDNGEVNKLDAVWRITIGLSLVPAFATIYQRLTLPEPPLHSAVRRRYVNIPLNSTTATAELHGESDEKMETEDVSVPADDTQKKAHMREFLEYLSEWKHAKHLIGTCLSWFLTNIAFFGVNLNQNFVLEQIGFQGTIGTPWQKLFRVATGSLIITVLGFLPGYYFTVFTIHRLGRKWIQVQGALMTALFLAILAAKFHSLGKAGFIVCFTLLQFFFNFGANMTIYIIPAELFPSRYRAFAHGISAASGRCGAIISSLVFNQLSKSAGTPVILWIFFAVSLLTVVVTLVFLPETNGRDADVIFEKEMQEKDARAA
ncbi:MFS transporter superfamily protein [Pleurotus pulmonarius]